MTEGVVELPPPGHRTTLPRGRPIGYVMAVGGALAFAVNGSVSKVTLGSGIDSLSLVLLRCAGATLALFVLVLLVEPARLRVRRSEWRLLVFYGIVGIALVQWLYFVAIARLPVGIALLIEFTAPVIVALWAKFVQHKDLGRSLWVALALALGGLSLVAQVWQGITLDLIGVLAAVGAAFALATYFIAGEKGVQGRDTLSFAFWAFVVATVFWSVVHPWWTVPWDTLRTSVPLQGRLADTDVTVWWLVGWIVLLGTVVPFLLVIGALRHVPATRAGLVGTIEPVLAGLVAWLWLDEVLSAVQVVGALIVIGGISVAQLSRPAAPADRSPAGQTPPPP